MHVKDMGIGCLWLLLPEPNTGDFRYGIHRHARPHFKFTGSSNIDANVDEFQSSDDDHDVSRAKNVHLKAHTELSIN